MDSEIGDNKNMKLGLYIDGAYRKQRKSDANYIHRTAKISRRKLFN